jgi:uncharacterized protein
MLFSIFPGVVLGRTGGMIKQLYVPFYFGLGGRMGSGDQWLPWIHIDDIAHLLLFAIENEKVKGVLNGVAPEVCCTSYTYSLRSIKHRARHVALVRVMGKPIVCPQKKIASFNQIKEDRGKLRDDLRILGVWVKE